MCQSSAMIVIQNFRLNRTSTLFMENIDTLNLSKARRILTMKNYMEASDNFLNNIRTTFSILINQYNISPINEDS